MNRDFKGVWIPRDVWLDKDLGWVEKLFFVEIDSLDNEQGCFASNGYFSKFFGITPQRASQIINSLVEKGKIISQLEMDGRRVTKRILRVPQHLRYQENLIGYQEKFKDNNTVNNTVNSLEKAEKTELRNLFFTKYRQKAKEITGTDLNADNRPISPVWTGKEGKLFNLDVEHHGAKTIEKYISLFFSDKIPEVAKFCRYEEKAGYGYSVFHGMIGKISMSKVKINICPKCGKDNGHNLWCEDFKAPSEKQEVIWKEIEKEKEEVGAVNLVGDMMDKMRRRKKENVENKSEQF